MVLRDKHWKLPPAEFVKVNYDGSLCQNLSRQRWELFAEITRADSPANSFRFHAPPLSIPPPVTSFRDLQLYSASTLVGPSKRSHI
ncbi:hypothetical protein K1719_025152 [Acacia pycnantha]|nr:hypothetical protein K1719_046830 [Acacia pycnantha]KAI9098527.1 hypothetical protein K1719_025152 [Acacia pycnantha]